mmetsp:Transcript_14388/g.42482  ORF Transcript_14388/g.42482 Transcript_14388/m.42482 type:complete len:485 (-) Transcript_14388:2032-3486(-)
MWKLLVGDGAHDVSPRVSAAFLSCAAPRGRGAVRAVRAIRVTRAPSAGLGVRGLHRVRHVSSSLGGFLRSGSSFELLLPRGLLELPLVLEVELGAVLRQLGRLEFGGHLLRGSRGRRWFRRACVCTTCDGRLLVFLSRAGGAGGAALVLCSVTRARRGAARLGGLEVTEQRSVLQDLALEVLSRAFAPLQFSKFLSGFAHQGLAAFAKIIGGEGPKVVVKSKPVAGPNLGPDLGPISVAMLVGEDKQVPVLVGAEDVAVCAHIAEGELGERVAPPCEKFASRHGEAGNFSQLALPFLHTAHDVLELRVGKGRRRNLPEVLAVPCNLLFGLANIHRDFGVVFASVLGAGLDELLVVLPGPVPEGLGQELLLLQLLGVIQELEDFEVRRQLPRRLLVVVYGLFLLVQLMEPGTVEELPVFHLGQPEVLWKLGPLFILRCDRFPEVLVHVVLHLGGLARPGTLADELGVHKGRQLLVLQRLGPLFGV